MDKFHSNPYNPVNQLITEKQVISIMESLSISNFKPNNLSFYQTAFVHKSYCSMKEYESYDQQIKHYIYKKNPMKQWNF